jgi:hypothetical protein
MENAVLVTFNTSLWPIERQDKQMTRAATEKLDLGSNAGVWKKYRANPKSEKWRRIKRVRGAVFNHVIYKFTLPWANGVRLCSAEAIEEIQAQIADFEAEFTDAVTDFVADRDEITHRYRKPISRKSPILSALKSLKSSLTIWLTSKTGNWPMHREISGINWKRRYRMQSSNCLQVTGYTIAC